MSEYAWVTLATNDSYSLGAMVLAHSLRQVGTTHQLVCIVTSGISDTMRTKLESVFDIIFEVNILDSRDEANLLLMQRPELGVTFTKLHCWRLTQFKKCVFLDADTLVLQNCDELFDREEFSAAPDVGWPDCFNSGVFVYQPSEATYESLIKFALGNRSFDGGDQGLLNLYFSDWAHKDIGKHLPFLYNMCSTACYSYLPAFKQFGDGMKIIHFIGATKPWLQYFNSETLRVNVGAGMEHLQKIVQLWWDIFCTHVHKMLCPDMAPYCGVASYNPIPNPSKFVNDESMLDESLITYDEGVTHPPFIDPWETYKNAPQENNHEIQEASLGHREDTRNDISNDNYNTDCKANHENANNHFVESHVVVSVINNHECNPSVTEHTVIETNKGIEKNDANCQFEECTNQTYSNNNTDTDCNVLNNNATHQETVKIVLPDESKAGDDSRTGNGGIAGALAQVSLGQPRSESQSAFEDHMRKQSWEVGNIDYMGRDRFDNIWSKISETLCSAPSQPTPKQDVVQKRKKSPSPRPKQTTPIRDVQPVKEPPQPTPPKQEQPQVKEPAQEKKQAPQPEKPVAAVEKKPAPEQKQPTVKSTTATTQAKKPVESPKSSEPPKASKVASSKAPPTPVESPTSPAASGAGSPVSPTPPPRKTTQTQKKVPKKK